MKIKNENLIAGRLGRIVGRVPYFRDRLDQHMLEIVNGSAIALVMKILSAGLAFAFNVMIARRIGVDGAGMFYLALSVVSVATIFGRMGLDNVMLRLIASNAGVSNWGAVKGVYRKGMSIVLIASFFSTAVVFTFSSWIAGFVFSKPELASTLRWMSLSIVPISMALLDSSALNGLKRIFDYSLVQGQNGVLLSFFSLVGIYLLGRAWGVQGAVWSYNFAAFLTVVISLLLWRNATARFKGKKEDCKMSTLLHSSIPLFWVSSMVVILNWSATFFLGIWGTAADVGIFSMASRTALLISLVRMAVNAISAPKFASLYAKGDMKTLSRIAVNSSTMMALLASPAFLLLVAAPGWVMALFGSKFAAGANALIILSIGQFVNVASGSVQYLLMMSGNERLVRNDVFLTLALNIILNCVLTPRFGIIGAAIATAISMAMQNVLAIYMIKSRLKIQTLPFCRSSVK